MADDEGILTQNRVLKKAVLDVMFQHCDTFYIHCMPHDRLVIGTRGLQEREKEEGIVLVFGPYSTRHLSWDEDFLYCELQFNRWEGVQIPYECIGRVFDKGGQVIMQWATPSPEEESAGDETKAGESNSASKKEDGDVQSFPTDKAAKSGGKRTASKDKGKPGDESRVIEVDFRKRRKD